MYGGGVNAVTVIQARLTVADGRPNNCRLWSVCVADMMMPHPVCSYLKNTLSLTSIC